MILSFLPGVLCTLVIISLPVPAPAANNAFTIERFPIKVLVNSEVFQPKDANGIAADRLHYDVLYHTDLNKTHGISNGLDPERINEQL